MLTLAGPAWIGANGARAAQGSPFVGRWAMVMPDGGAGWLAIEKREGKLEGQLWTVGRPRTLKDLSVVDGKLSFTQKCRVGEPEYAGGPPTGERVDCPHVASLRGEKIRVEMHVPSDNQVETKPVVFEGRKIAPLPPRPDLAKVRFGAPINLFNGQDLAGWKLTNSRQTNGWKAVKGVLVNDTPKLDFQPYSKYGNLRTVREFADFELSIEFKVPVGGNSGVYLRGLYEAQVVDRDSRMQGIQGVGAIFGRIAPSQKAGKPGGLWQHYKLTLVDRHITVVLNGIKVIDNQPLEGCTNGALHADVTKRGPIYLQGDHTAVAYRNIVLRPILKTPSGR